MGNSCIVSKEKKIISCVILDVYVSMTMLTRKHTDRDLRQTIANYYGIEIYMLETEHGLFKKFLESHENIVVKAASDVTEVLHDNQLCDLIPLFSKLASIFAFFPASSKTAE